MDRDTFIITVYCLVVEHYAIVTSRFKLRRGCFQPALTDEEVITMEGLVEGFTGLVPADKGFIDPYRQQLLQQRYGVRLVAAVRSNMKEQQPPAVAKACKRWRKVVETVGSHLTELFAIARTRAHDLWHYQ